MDEISILIQCDICGATSKIEHDMDEERYTVEYCPCCGTEEIVRVDV